MGIAGKVALITGGAGGIGLAITQELLKHGAKGIAIVDIAKANGEKALATIQAAYGPNRAIFLPTDTTKAEEFEAAFQSTVQVFGQLDFVFNNAGFVDERDFERTININLIGTTRGTYLAMMKYLPQYKSGSEGVIINTASVAGFQLFRALPAYSASKIGILGLGMALGTKEYYEKYKVRVLSICPGLVDTPMTDKTTFFPKVFFPEAQDQDMTDFERAETPESFASNIPGILAAGASGSMWVIENQRPAYEIAFPAKLDMKK